MNDATTSRKALGPLPRWLFMSRWLQAPLSAMAIALTEKLTYDTAVAQKHHKNDTAAPIPQPGV